MEQHRYAGSQGSARTRRRAGCTGTRADRFPPRCRAAGGGGPAGQERTTVTGPAVGGRGPRPSSSSLTASRPAHSPGRYATPCGTHPIPTHGGREPANVRPLNAGCSCLLELHRTSHATSMFAACRDKQNRAPPREDEARCPKKDAPPARPHPISASATSAPRTAATTVGRRRHLGSTNRRADRPAAVAGPAVPRRQGPSRPSAARQCRRSCRRSCRRPGCAIRSVTRRAVPRPFCLASPGLRPAPLKPPCATLP